MASRRNGTLYIGQTEDVLQRAQEHKQGAYDGFTKRYRCYRLVWVESHDTRESAFTRERQMKDWNRAWKIRRIEDLNPDWIDLSETMTLDDLYDKRRKFPSDKHIRLGRHNP